MFELVKKLLSKAVIRISCLPLILAIIDNSVGASIESNELKGWNFGDETYSNKSLWPLRIRSIRRKRNILTNEEHRWPDGVVPFVVVGNFDLDDLYFIENVMEEFHNKTCIKFVPRHKHRNYIIIDNKCIGCRAQIGFRGGKQLLNLQKNSNCQYEHEKKTYCLSKLGGGIHEFMHTLGFDHEHNRYDRDIYVEILFENIRDVAKNQFQKKNPENYTNLDLPYDYTSVMHYANKAFTKNPRLKTINAKKQFHGTMGQKENFSSGDIQKINEAYKCHTTTSSTGYKLAPINIYPRRSDYRQLIIDLSERLRKFS